MAFAKTPHLRSANSYQANLYMEISVDSFFPFVCSINKREKNEKKRQNKRLFEF